MFVVVHMDCYGYDDFGGSCQAVYGPYETKEKADKKQKEMEAQNIYAAEFYVHELEA